MFGLPNPNRALTLYAKTLPPRLARDYGASEFYTQGQINKAVAALRLDPKFIAHAYAMFLPETQFNALPAENRGKVPYPEARAAFKSRMPARPTSDPSFGESGVGFSGAGITDGGWA